MRVRVNARRTNQFERVRVTTALTKSMPTLLRNVVTEEIFSIEAPTGHASLVTGKICLAFPVDTFDNDRLSRRLETRDCPSVGGGSGDLPMHSAFLRTGGGDNQVQVFVLMEETMLFSMFVLVASQQLKLPAGTLPTKFEPRGIRVPEFTKKFGDNYHFLSNSQHGLQRYIDLSVIHSLHDALFDDLLLGKRNVGVEQKKACAKAFARELQGIMRIIVERYIDHQRQLACWRKRDARKKREARKLRAEARKAELTASVDETSDV